MLRVGISAAPREVVMNFKISRSLYICTYICIVCNRIFFLCLNDMCDCY